MRRWAETLERLAEQRDRDADDAERKFDKVREASVREEDVAIALRSLPSHVAVEDKKEQVEGDHWAAKQSLGNVGAQITRLEKSLRELEPSCQSLQINISDEAVATDMTPDRAEEAAVRAEAESAGALRDAQEANKLAQEIKEKAWETQAQLSKCEAVTRRLNDVREHYADLLDEVGIAPYVTDDKETSDRVESIETAGVGSWPACL